MRTVARQLEQAARHPAATVLFTGESGEGKDVAARDLHRLTFGERAAQTPYVALNCAAVPGEMFEAELFGAERGAYTGADKKRQGLVSAAQGGKLFLDEIAEVPMTSQAKLLRFLEGREFRALGGTLCVGNLTVNNGAPFVVGDGVNPAALELRGRAAFANEIVVSPNATLTGCASLAGGVTVMPGGANTRPIAGPPA
jgi:MoxR-like ATPase